MSRTLTSPIRQVSSSTWRSSFPSAKQAISRGRRNPRRRKPVVFISRAFSAIIPSLSMSQESIQVRGARVNNLKNVSFSIPINQMTVVTGVSGSGKSSLAFDTIYAEGQRSYVESLSAYARQFLERMDKPDVDEVSGIAPAIAIRQKNSTRNPRSTVGTQTEIYDYRRLLFARVGQTYCRVCGRVVSRDSPESAADEVLSKLSEGTRFYVLFPASAGLQESQKQPEKGKTKPRRPNQQSLRFNITAHLMSLMQRGFTRMLVDN